jgi:hypothetical protein
MRAPKGGLQFGPQPGRIRRTTPGQSPNDDAVRRLQIAEKFAGCMPKPTGHPMTFDGITHRLGDDQPDLRR